MEEFEGYINDVRIVDKPKPVCYLRWVDDGGYGITISIYRDFNWFQKKMLKWCFGLVYAKTWEE